MFLSRKILAHGLKRLTTPARNLWRIRHGLVEELALYIKSLVTPDLSRTKQLVQPMVSFLIFDAMSCGVGAPKLRPMHEVFPARGLSRRNYSLQDLNTVL